MATESKVVNRDSKLDLFEDDDEFEIGQGNLSIHLLLFLN